MSPLETPQGRGHLPGLPSEPRRAVEPGFLQDEDGGDADDGALLFKLFDGSGHGGENGALMQVTSSAFMHGDAGGAFLRQSRPMNAAQSIRQWMRGTLDASGQTVKAWAEAAGVAPSTVHRALKDDYEFITSSRTLNKLATAAGVAAPDATATETLLAKAEFLPIRYDVGAGLWQEMPDSDIFLGTGTVAPDPAYSGFPQWLERVQGDSMDREYRPGDLVHVVDAYRLGYAARHGDHIILVRRRQGGGEVERTIKEVVRTAEAFEFWPRSNNPRWNSPIILSDGLADDGTEVEVAGLVVGSYRPRR